MGGDFITHISTYLSSADPHAPSTAGSGAAIPTHGRDFRNAFKKMRFDSHSSERKSSVPVAPGTPPGAHPGGGDPRALGGDPAGKSERFDIDFAIKFVYANAVLCRLPRGRRRCCRRDVTRHRRISNPIKAIKITDLPATSLKSKCDFERKLASYAEYE